nr:hypothetical protein [Tanacetum cinerariifolium]
SPGDKIICDLNKTPDLSQRPSWNCPKCGHPVDGQYKDVLFSERNLRKICLHIALKIEFSKILSSNPMTITTLLILFKIYSLSHKTPVKIPHKLLHKSTIIIVTGVKKEEEKQIKEEQAAKACYWKILVCYDDDDEEYTIAITHKEPDNSLSMGDEHLDTISATKSDKFIKSSIENLCPNPKESLLKHDPLIISSSSKIDFLFDEFTEIDLSFTPDDPMSLGFEEDDYDSEREILILEEWLSNDSLSLPKNESFHFDIPSSSRPPTKPPDGNSGILNVNVMGGISKHKVLLPRLMLTQPTLVPNQEKSPNLLPNLGHEAF